MNIRVELSPKVDIQLKNLRNNEFEEPALSCGGLLIGFIKSVGDAVVIEVTDCIVAKVHHDFLDEILYSSGLWKDMFKEKNTQYPENQIVGWFLSSTNNTDPGVREIEIHNKFFSGENKVLITSGQDSPTSAYICLKNAFVQCSLWLSKPDKPDNSEMKFEKAHATEQDITEVNQSKQFHIPVTLKKIIVFTSIFGICVLSIMYKDLTKPINYTVSQGSSTAQGDSIKTEPKTVPSAKPLVKPSVEPSQSAPVSPEASSGTQEREQPKEPADPNDSQNSNAVASGAIQKYVVKKGDSLWTISEKYYGTGFLFYKIMKQNEVINPNTLFVGQVLEIPEEEL